MTALTPTPPIDALPVRTAPKPGQALRAVIRRGLADRRRAVGTWGLSIGAYGAFMAAIYPSIQSSIEKLVRSYPSGLREAFGVQTMSTVQGYIHAEMFSLIVPLALGLFVIRAITSATVAAEERGALDTILTLPISRSALLVGSYAAAAAASAAIMAMTGVMLFSSGRIAGTNISPGLVAAGVMGVWPLALFCGGVAAVAAGLLHSSRAVTGISLGVLVAMYALDLAGRLASGLAPLRWASAFRYYGAPMRDGIDPAAFVGLAGAGVLLLLVGARLLERRDVLH
jgi:ABC-2 type transport system permease protein